MYHGAAIFAKKEWAYRHNTEH